MTKGEMIQEYYDKAVELAAYCENDDLNHYDLDVDLDRWVWTWTFKGQGGAAY